MNIIIIYYYYNNLSRIPVLKDENPCCLLDGSDFWTDRREPLNQWTRPHISEGRSPPLYLCETSRIAYAVEF
jgi:hypothetical protein